MCHKLDLRVNNTLVFELSHEFGFKVRYDTLTTSVVGAKSPDRFRIRHFVASPLV